MKKGEKKGVRYEYNNKLGELEKGRGCRRT